MQNTINVSVFRTLGGGSWIVMPSLPIWIYHCSTGPSLDALWACVPLSISLHVNIVPDVLPRSFCGWPCASLHLLEEAHDHLILRTCVTWSAKSLTFFPCCTSTWSCSSLVWKSLLSIDPRSPTTNLISLNCHFGAAALSAPMML